MMDIKRLTVLPYHIGLAFVLVLISQKVIAEKGACVRNPGPVAQICRSSNVTGTTVSIDTSLFKASDRLECNCRLNVSSPEVLAVTTSAPGFRGCGASLDIVIGDSSKTFDCAMGTHNSNQGLGYISITNTSQYVVDADYCVLFQVRQGTVSVICDELINEVVESDPVIEMSTPSTTVTDGTYTTGTGIQTTASGIPNTDLVTQSGLTSTTIGYESSTVYVTSSRNDLNDFTSPDVLQDNNTSNTSFDSVTHTTSSSSLNTSQMNDIISRTTETIGIVQGSSTTPLYTLGSETTSFTTDVTNTTMSSAKTTFSTEQNTSSGNHELAGTGFEVDNSTAVSFTDDQMLEMGPGVRNGTAVSAAELKRLFSDTQISEDKMSGFLNKYPDLREVVIEPVTTFPKDLEGKAIDQTMKTDVETSTIQQTEPVNTFIQTTSPALEVTEQVYTSTFPEETPIVNKSAILLKYPEVNGTIFEPVPGDFLSLDKTKYDASIPQTTTSDVTDTPTNGITIATTSGTPTASTSGNGETPATTDIPVVPLSTFHSIVPFTNDSTDYSTIVDVSTESSTGSTTKALDSVSSIQFSVVSNYSQDDIIPISTTISPVLNKSEIMKKYSNLSDVVFEPVTTENISVESNYSQVDNLQITTNVPVGVDKSAIMEKYSNISDVVFEPVTSENISVGGNYSQDENLQITTNVPVVNKSAIMERFTNISDVVFEPVTSENISVGGNNSQDENLQITTNVPVVNKSAIMERFTNISDVVFEPVTSENISVRGNYSQDENLQTTTTAPLVDKSAIMAKYSNLSDVVFEPVTIEPETESIPAFNDYQTTSLSPSSEVSFVPDMRENETSEVNSTVKNITTQNNASSQTSSTMQTVSDTTDLSTIQNNITESVSGNIVSEGMKDNVTLHDRETSAAGQMVHANQTSDSMYNDTQRMVTGAHYEKLTLTEEQLTEGTTSALVFGEIESTTTSYKTSTPISAVEISTEQTSAQTTTGGRKLAESGFFINEFTSVTDAKKIRGDIPISSVESTTHGDITSTFSDKSPHTTTFDQTTNKVLITSSASISTLRSVSDISTTKRIGILDDTTATPMVSRSTTLGGIKDTTQTDKLTTHIATETGTRVTTILPDTKTPERKITLITSDVPMESTTKPITVAVTTERTTQPITPSVTKDKTTTMTKANTTDNKTTAKPLSTPDTAGHKNSTYESGNVTKDEEVESFYMNNHTLTIIIIGSVVGVLVIIAIIVIIASFMKSRRRSADITSFEKGDMELNGGGIDNPLVQLEQERQLVETNPNPALNGSMDYKALASPSKVPTEHNEQIQQTTVQSQQPTQQNIETENTSELK